MGKSIIQNVTKILIQIKHYNKNVLLKMQDFLCIKKENPGFTLPGKV